MIEKLYSLIFPPGLFHNGTKNQAAGRWYDGNGIRFFQKTIQPIGGWVQRTLTGATITGVPNYAIGLLRNNDAKFLIIGTSTGLFVVDASNVVYNITPTVLVGQTTLDWHLETFGQDLVATVKPFVNTDKTNYYYWEGDTGVEALPVNGVDAYFDSPHAVRALVATPERFLFLLQGEDPAVDISLGPTAGSKYRAARSGFTYSIDPGPLLID